MPSEASSPTLPPGLARDPRLLQALRDRAGAAPTSLWAAVPVEQLGGDEDLDEPWPAGALWALPAPGPAALLLPVGGTLPADPWSLLAQLPCRVVAAPRGSAALLDPEAWAWRQNAHWRACLGAAAIGPLQAGLHRRLACLGHSGERPAARDRWDALRRAADPIAAAPDEDPRPALRAASTGVDFISLDIFDTCLRRRVRTPQGVFALLQLDLQLAGLRPPRDFVAQRIAAEQQVRAAHRAAGSSEDLVLAEVYAALAEPCGWDGASAAEALAIEEAREAVLVYAVPALRAWVEELRQQGRPHAWTSEMYLDAPWLAARLTALGFGEAPVVRVSGECRVVKGTGNLFRHVLQAEGRDPAAVLHVGDHPESDVAVPASLGLRTFHLRPEHHARCWADEAGAALRPLGPLGELSWGLARESRLEARSLEWRLGFEVAGPLAAQCLNLIYLAARAEADHRLAFLARDGFLLRAVHHRLAPAWGLEFEDVYLAASRQLLGLAAITEIDASDWDFLLKPAPGLSLADLLRRLGLDPAACRAAAETHGLGSDSERPLCAAAGWIDPADRDRVYRVIVDHIAAFHAHREPLRQRVLAYLRERGAAEAGVRFIDLGWQGSSARALHRLRSALEATGPTRVDYFATWRRADEVAGAAEITGAYTHLGAPAAGVARLESGIALIEQIFSAPHASVRDLERLPDGWEALPGPEAEDAAERARQDRLTQIQAGAEAFAEQLAVLLPGPVADDDFGYLDATLDRLLGQPTTEEAHCLGTWTHTEAWGVERATPLCPWPPSRESTAALLAAYQSSAWKPGFLAGLDPLQRERLRHA